MKTKMVRTFTATIYVGLLERASGSVTGREVAMEAIQEYVNSVGLCVSVSDTEFVYTNGREPGLAVGLINYPRFPSSATKIAMHANAIAKILMDKCKQLKVSVVCPIRTVMFSEDP